MIPHNLHHVWLGPNPLPDDFAGYVETWKHHHPEWSFHFWTEDNLPAELRRPEVRDRLRVPAERADILRLEVLWLYGGVYVDTDFECLRPIDPLLEGVDLFAAIYKFDRKTQKERLNNAILGAAPQHAVVDRALNELRPRNAHGYDKYAAGPFFVDRLFQEAGATIFPRPLFYPSWAERDEAVAFHHMARTWKDGAGLQRSTKLARERTARAQAELEALIHRRRQAQLQVAALERRLRSRESGRNDGALVQTGYRLALAADEASFRVRGRARTTAGRGRHYARRAVEKSLARLGPDVARTRARADVRGRSSVRVPRVLHHLWLGSEPLEPEVDARIGTWRIAHPDWELRLWTDETLPRDLERREIYELLRSPAERADMARIQLLERHGGVAVDSDLVCRRRIDRLVAGSDCFAASDADGAPSTVLLGSTPGHPALAQILAQTQPVEWHGHSNERTGGGALARARAAGAAIDLLPPESFAPRTAAERRRAYGVITGPRTTAADRSKLADEVIETEQRQRGAERSAQRCRDEVEALERRLAELGKAFAPVPGRS